MTGKTHFQNSILKTQFCVYKTVLSVLITFEMTSNNSNLNNEGKNCNESPNDSFLEINGAKVFYEKFGTGAQVALLVPGAIGTGRTDFEKQLIGSDAFDMKEFTFISIELPGWGRSRPPERPRVDSYPDIYQYDCEFAQALMEVRGLFRKFN